MTWKELLRELRELAAEDGVLNEQVSLPDLLDYCGILGLSGASQAHLAQVREPAKLHVLKGGKRGRK